MFGICNLAIIPLRLEPSDRSEIVSQVLFGEHFQILEQLKPMIQNAGGTGHTVTPIFTDNPGF